MVVTYLIPGSGGSFYCGNCHRDMLYMKAVRQVNGYHVSAIPLYLLPDIVNSGDGYEHEVFFGAVSMYLREKVHFLQKMPAFIDKFLDSGPLLRLAAKQAGTTRTEGLEETTLNMIRGDYQVRQPEVERLAAYLIKNGKPDIIHISNALIIGLAKQLKDVLGVPVVCSLENEDDWIDDMAEPFKAMAWQEIGKQSPNVDAFISPSQYFKNLFISRTGISGDKIYVVPSGTDRNPANTPPGKPDTKAIGYYSRINFHNGFDKIVDAFLKIKNDGLLPDYELHVCGGFTGDDKSFVKEQLSKIKKSGHGEKVKYCAEFHGRAKEEFFRNIDILSVPVRKYDAYGLYVVEANASGIPVVQPATGAFPEIIEMTGGGIIYQPDTVDELAATLVRLSSDSNLRNELSMNGKAGVERSLSMQKMAERIIEVYNKAAGRST